MPYNKVSDLPETIRVLPKPAQELFLKVFNESVKQGKSEDMAFKIAWGSVKQKYHKPKGKWIAKSSSIIPKVYNVKSAISPGKAYVGEFIFGDTQEDLDGDEVSWEALCTKIDGMEGDLEHANLFGRTEISRDPLFKVLNSFFNGTHLMGYVLFKPEHPQFSSVWEQVKKGDFGISMEYDKLQDVVGITGTCVPRNQRSKVLSAKELEM